MPKRPSVEKETMVKRITNFDSKRETNNAPSLREAMITAAAAIGRDGKGDGGLAGYFEALVMKQPKLFVGLLTRLLAYEPAIGEKNMAAEAERVRARSAAKRIREELLKDVPLREWPSSPVEAVALQQQQRDKAKNG
jgi:hypothetical protein